MGGTWAVLGMASRDPHLSMRIATNHKRTKITLRTRRHRVTEVLLSCAVRSMIGSYTLPSRRHQTLLPPPSLHTVCSVLPMFAPGWRMRGTARPNVCAASGAAAKPLFHMPFAFFMCFPSGYENTVLYMTAAYRGEGFRLSKMGRICRGKRFGNSICYTSRHGRRS
jgi:hypothetical protein